MDDKRGHAWNVADEARSLADDDEEQCTDQNAPMVAGTAKQHRQPNLEGDDRHELADMHDAKRMRPQAPRRAAEHPADDQRLQLSRTSGLAKRAGGRFVIAD